MRDFELEKLQEITQAKIDDASKDHLYVGSASCDYDLGTTPNVAIGMECSPDPKVQASREEALSFAAAQVALIYRANGGHGRPVVRMIRTDRGLEAHLGVWTSALDAFDWCIRGLRAEA